MGRGTLRSEHLPFIDWMKCVGMLLIVYGHVAAAGPFNSIPPIYTKQLGVAFFVFVTGFTLARETRGRWFVVFNRLFEVYLYGFVIALVVSIVGYATFGAISKSNYLPFFLGANVLFNFLPANPTTWYIGTYAHILLMWGLVVHRHRVRPWMLAVAMPAEIVIRAALLDGSRDMIAYMLIPNWATVFLLGLLAGQSERKVRGSLAGRVSALVALAVGWGFVTRAIDMQGAFPFMQLSGDRTAAKALLVSACVSLVYVSFTGLGYEVARRIEDSPAVRFLARNTLFVFIAHMPVYYLLIWLWQGWAVDGWVKAALRLIVCFPVLALVSELFGRVVRPRALRADVWNRLKILAPRLA